MSISAFRKRREMEARKNGVAPVKSEAVSEPVKEPPVKEEVTEEVTETVQEEDPVKKTDAEKLKGK